MNFIGIRPFIHTKVRRCFWCDSKRLGWQSQKITQKVTLFPKGSSWMCNFISIECVTYNYIAGCCYTTISLDGSVVHLWVVTSVVPISVNRTQSWPRNGVIPFRLIPNPISSTKSANVPFCLKIIFFGQWEYIRLLMYKMILLLIHWECSHPPHTFPWWSIVPFHGLEGVERWSSSISQ